MLEVKDVKYSYIKGKPVLDGLSFSTGDESVVLYGGLGFGKSTLCKIIAREIKKFDGDVLINGTSIKKKKAKELNVSYITEDFMLSKNQTVRRNAAEALIVKHTPIEKIPPLVDEALKICGLFEYGDVLAKRLSDCDMFFTALSRSLAKKPDLIIVDDVFSGKSKEEKLRLYGKILPVLSSLSYPVLFVTSEDYIAKAFDKRTLVLSYGKLAYDGLFSKSVYDTSPQEQ